MEPNSEDRDDFQIALKKDFQPSEWALVSEEVNAWLNYEYARSYGPLMREVLKLRNPKNRSKHEYYFAKYLAKNFPEFPKESWQSINPAIRRNRLQQAECYQAADGFK